MISQQLARAKLSSQAPESIPNEGPAYNNNNLLPGLARHPSSSSNLSNRAVSSGSIAGTGRIEEEQDGVFSMEDDADDHSRRYSGIGRSPGMGVKSYWG